MSIEHPIESLRRKSPHLFESPDFWKSSWQHVEEAAARAGTGVCREIGQSAGGRSIPVFQYGPAEPVKPSTTISSAMASDSPKCFYDPTQRARPSVVLIGMIHGGETEGMALALSLIDLMETGRDSMGKERPGLREKMDRVRLTLLPCLNPDGRIKSAVDHLNGAELEELFLIQQGVFRDGTLFRGRKIKEVQPVPEGMLTFRGGYYNDQGVNLQHDDFFGPTLAPENQAVARLFREEIPDAFLTLHAHGALPAFLTPDAHISPGMQRKQVEAAGFILSKFHERNIEFLPPDRIVTPPWSFFFQTWLHHMTGATPLLFEFCHGLKMRPSPLEEILETGMVLMEAWLDYLLIFGPRPLSHELFGEITPAK